MSPAVVWLMLASIVCIVLAASAAWHRHEAACRSLAAASGAWLAAAFLALLLSLRLPCG